MLAEDSEFAWLLDELPAGLHIKPEPGGRIKLGWAYNNKTSEPQEDLANVCEQVNDFLFQRTTPERYATFFAARLRTDRTFTYVNAGHNPPLLVRVDGDVDALGPTGPALGFLPGLPESEEAKVRVWVVTLTAAGPFLFLAVAALVALLAGLVFFFVEFSRNVSFAPLDL